MHFLSEYNCAHTSTASYPAVEVFWRDQTPVPKSLPEARAKDAWWHTSHTHTPTNDTLTSCRQCHHDLCINNKLHRMRSVSKSMPYTLMALHHSITTLDRPLVGVETSIQVSNHHTTRAPLVLQLHLPPLSLCHTHTPTHSHPHIHHASHHTGSICSGEGRCYTPDKDHECSRV